MWMRGAVVVSRRRLISARGAHGQTGSRALSQQGEGEEERLTRTLVRRLADELVRPASRPMECAKLLEPGLLRTLHEAGLLGMELGPEYGGSGSSFSCVMVAVEELARADASVAVLVDIQNTLVNAIISRFGSPTQKLEYLPRLARDTIGCFCLSEPGSGSDAFALKTVAEPDGPNHFLINGSKMWVSNSDLARLFIVFANADPSAGYRGITAFLVQRDTPGLIVGKPEMKLGLEASGTCAVNLEDVRVHKENVLGERGKGYKYAAALLNESRIGIGAQMLGVAQGCFDATIPYTLQRKQFGQDIFSFQSMKHQIAQMATEIECARLLVYNASRMVDRKEDVMREASMAKFYASEMAQRVTSKCIDLMGGVGFTKDYPQEKYFRDCKAGTIYEGTSNMQLTTIAKCIQKMYS